jgi:Ca2+/Na+ antiporter
MRVFIMGGIGGFLLLASLFLLVDNENNTLNVLMFFGIIIFTIFSYYLYDNFVKKKKENLSNKNIEIVENKSEVYMGEQKKKSSPFFRAFLFVILFFIIFYIFIVGTISFSMRH